MFRVETGPRASSGQDVAPLAAPDHEGDHGQREENRDEDEDGERVVGRVHVHHLPVGAVREEVLVHADDVALHRRVGPVAVHEVGLGLCAQGEEVVLAEDRKTGIRGEPAARPCEAPRLDLTFAGGQHRSALNALTLACCSLKGRKKPFNCLW